MRIARPLRKTMLNMVLVMGVGLAGLLALVQIGGAFTETTIAVVLRELAYLPVAVGVTLILLTFLFQALLAKSALPHILGDVLLALLLIAFVLYRMNAAGVNLASIITTSAVITAVIAFSLQETLGNLWGGIALQLDNTCRIGDWIRIGNITGRIVDIRWRCLAVATNDGETVMIPNAHLIKNQVTVLARRGDQKIPGAAGSTSRSPTTSRRPKSWRRSKRRLRVRRFPLSPTSRHQSAPASTSANKASPTTCCTGSPISCMTWRRTRKSTPTSMRHSPVTTWKCRCHGACC
jgi:hypothetical protein